MIKQLFQLFINPQMIVYGLVGGFTTGLDFFLYWLLVEYFSVWYIAAAAIISPTTLALNFFMHRVFTFKSTGKKRVQLVKYLLLVAFNYAAGLSLLYFFVDIVGLHYLLGRITVFALILIWNFLGLKKVVFS